ncbi:hypothetical protein Dimus_013494 [Dionaea muscipula]
MVVRRSFSQRRIVEEVCDSQSPEPSPPLLFWGSPSPTSPRHRRPMPSPRTRPRRHRSPSPLLRTSSDPDEFSTSEEGDPLEAVVTSSKAEDHSDLEEGRPIPCPVSDQSPIVEEDEDRLVDTILGALTASPERILEMKASIPRSSSTIEALRSERSSSANGFLMVGEGAIPGSGGAQNGDVLLPSMVSDDSQCTASAKVSHSPALFSMDAVHVGGGPVILEVQTVKQNLCSTEPQLVGSNVQVADEPNCVSSYPLISGLGGCVGDGLVSEESRVSPVAREALRPQPAGGLRQPPLSPVEPVNRAEGGVDQDGRFGSSISLPLSPIPLLSSIRPVLPTVGVTWPRRRNEILERWEQDLLVSPAAFSRKRESKILLSRIFMKKVIHSKAIGCDVTE